LLNYQDPNILFYWLLVLYFGLLVLGYVLGKLGVIQFGLLAKVGQKLGDPLTIRLHKWLSGYKSRWVKEGKWSVFFIIILLNNLFLSAFVTRVLYGVFFFVPLLYTVWNGISHGVLFATPKGKASAPLVLEFGGYLFASVIGLSIGINLFTSLLSWTLPTPDIPWFYVGASFLAIFLGAAVETLSIKALSQKVDLKDIDTQKEEFVKKLNED
jgi:hypothetical protein